MNIDVLNNNEIIIDIPKTTGYFIIKQEKDIFYLYRKNNINEPVYYIQNFNKIYDCLMYAKNFIKNK